MRVRSGEVNIWGGFGEVLVIRVDCGGGKEGNVGCGVVEKRINRKNDGEIR